MKNTLTRLVGAALLTGAVSVANATPITLSDVVNFTANGANANEDLESFDGYELGGFGDSVEWTHNYVFMPPAASILSATLSLDLRDDQGWNFNFENGLYWGDDAAPELGIGWTEDGVWDFGEVDTGEHTYNVSLSAVADGAYSVLLASAGGDFYIDRSTLSINYLPVPEPGTVLLLGSGLIGLMLARRRQRAA